ncbi:protein lethal(2)essential for life [Caerostris darwini]|uniref:Protein lethal(2)essential for life n=1 Tax=Caerostris darwini TaxID=1538125 RepID=A0AAV4MZ31_9ARAC|nr:protein lethal(2)essential for life [Caerostris darwini]
MFPRLLHDLYEPTDYDRYNILPCEVSPTPYFIVRQRPQVPVAPFKSDANKVQLRLDLMYFRPDEIDVKTVDNFVVIHAKHEEQADKYGFVSREFTRRCQLPDDVEPHTVTASLSQDDVLTIEAPRKRLEPPPKNERIVPITIQLPAAVVVAQKQQQQQLQEQQQQTQEQQQKAAQQASKEPKQ